MSSVLVGVAAAALALGCDVRGEEVSCGAPVPVTVMSYNLAGAAGPSGESIASHIADVSPDFVGAQECGECQSLLDRLPPGYQMTAEPRAGVTILYDTTSWRLHDHGFVPLGDDDDGWGERVASWARFSSLDTDDCVFVYSTHWCVPIRSDDDACDEDRQVEYARALMADLDGRDDTGGPAIVTGDFNVFPAFENSPAIQLMLDTGLEDVFRTLNPDLDGTTFQGNSWAPPGRIDYIFATRPVDVLAAYVDRDAIEPGQGSDHYAVVASLDFATAGAPAAHAPIEPSDQPSGQPSSRPSSRR